MHLAAGGTTDSTYEESDQLYSIAYASLAALRDIPVAQTMRLAEIVYDLWDEKLRVRISTSKPGAAETQVVATPKAAGEAVAPVAMPPAAVPPATAPAVPAVRSGPPARPNPAAAQQEHLARVEIAMPRRAWAATKRLAPATVHGPSRSRKRSSNSA